LDAFGILYVPGDDVQGTLLPFIAERGGIKEEQKAHSLYRDASLGNLEPQAFWRAVGLNPNVEDQYLARIRLMPGVHEFLRAAAHRFDGIACLSNDVSAWSRKLRERLGLDTAISTWLISGDVGIRKPSPAIYEILLRRLNVPGNELIFVDDRLPNLDAALPFGIQTVWLHPEATSLNGHTAVQSLAEVLDLPRRS
jgi:putative hydrolase of the HAD superfamily